MFAEMRERLELSRETYCAEREAGHGRVSAGLAALRAASAKGRGARARPEDVRERLARIIGREDREAEVERDGPGCGRERLREALDRDRGGDGPEESDGGEKRSIRERLDDVLNKPRERLGIEDEPKTEREVENEREIDREIDRDPGLSH